MAMNLLMMPTLHVGQGTHLGGMSVFPVWTDAPVVSGLDTGRSARVQVAEREGSPVVGELVRSAQTLANGWDRQDQVWERVSRYDTAFGASPTASYVDHLNRRAAPFVGADPDLQGDAYGDGQAHEAQAAHEAEAAASAELASRIKNIRALPGQRGVLIGLGGQPAFLEMFASPAGLRRHLPGLLEAAAMDAAMLRAERTPGRRARRFAGLLADAPIGDVLGADAGAGRALASRSKYHEIRGLGWNDHLLHATVFNRRHHLMEVA